MRDKYFNKPLENSTSRIVQREKKAIVGVVLPSSLTESFEICLARIVDLNQDGENVKIMACNGKIKGCVSNPLRNKSICKHCRRVRDTALDQLVPGVEILSLDDYSSNVSMAVSEAEAEEIEAGVNSTILTFYRSDVESSTQGSLRRIFYSKLADRYREHSLFVCQAVFSLLQSNQVSRIEFFNGRIVPTRGALVAASRSGRDFCVLEVSGRQRHLTVTRNNSVHDLKFKQDELKKFISNSDFDHTNGRTFFELRRRGGETDARSFTNRQERGLLRRSEKPILAIFTSSADELKVAGSQWFNPASQNPVPFILQLSKIIREQYDIIVRMHPNQAGDKTGAAGEMLDTLRSAPDIDVIPPDSRISSYELLDEARVVLTFGSTMGLEATFWGKPSILAGRALWDCLDIAYRVSTPKETAILIGNGVEVRSLDHTLSTGAYYMNGTGATGSLSWQHNGSTGFFVNGESFLSIKRSSFTYWLSRLAQRFLKHL